MYITMSYNLCSICIHSTENFKLHILIRVMKSATSKIYTLLHLMKCIWLVVNNEQLKERKKKKKKRKKTRVAMRNKIGCNPHKNLSTILGLIMNRRVGR